MKVMEDYYGQHVLDYLAKNHPDVTRYSSWQVAFRVMRKHKLPCRKISANMEAGGVQQVWSATALELDGFADYWRKNLSRSSKKKIKKVKPKPSPTPSPTPEGRYWGESINQYLAKHHPDVVRYKRLHYFYARIRRWNLPYQKIRVIQETGRSCVTYSFSAAELDRFADKWREERHLASSPKVAVVAPTPKREAVSARKGGQRWRNVDEMIECFAGTGVYRYVPTGVMSLEELA